jgi:hypothetical protein
VCVGGVTGVGGRLRGAGRMGLHVLQNPIHGSGYRCSLLLHASRGGGEASKCQRRLTGPYAGSVR